MNKLKYIFFDADDTLWENEHFFREAEHQFALLLSEYTESDGIQELLWRKQEENIPLFGYGSKTYLIGMTDAATEICGGILPVEIYTGIKKIITGLAFHEFRLIDGVVETLEALHRKYKLAVATKGDLSEQMYKYRKSGLEKYFHHIEVMQNKTEKDYIEMAGKFDIDPKDILMVGNSVKSDIAPVINIGGMAIKTPHEVEWIHEKMEMPVSDRIFIVKKITEIIKIIP